MKKHLFLILQFMFLALGLGLSFFPSLEYVSIAFFSIGIGWYLIWSIINYVKW